jgi:hypothetical protein
MGNYHAQFLGGLGLATAPGYPVISAVRFSCDYLNISVLYFDDTVPREWYRLSGMPIRLFFVPYGNIIEPSIKVPYMEQKQDDYL